MAQDHLQSQVPAGNGFRCSEGPLSDRERPLWEAVVMAKVSNHPGKITLPYTLRIAFAALVFVGGLSPEAAPATTGTVKNIVLVHGAITDGSGWRGVYDILTNDGYHVS